MSKFQHARAPENMYLLERLDAFRARLARAGDERKALNTRKIIRALEVFPLPVVSGKLAEDLVQGVGPWFAVKIDEVLRDRPQKRASSQAPTPVQKLPKLDFACGSSAWALLLTLLKAGPVAPAAFTEAFEACLAPVYLVEDPSPVDFSYIVDLNLAVVQTDRCVLTPYGQLIANKLLRTMPKSALRFTETSAEVEFDPDSWVQEEPEVPLGLPHSYNSSVVLQVDTAERLSNDFQAIEHRLSNRGLAVEKCKLWIGDYQWVCRVNNTDLHIGIIIERKTADDLAASIIDGRYESQKHRMKAAGAKCIYLLEGTRPSASMRITRDTLLNAMIGTLFSCGFHIKVVQDTRDTLNWLARMTAGLQMVLGTWTAEQIRQLPTTAEFFERTHPSKHLTVKEVFGRQLRSIGFFGEHTTLAILSAYGTPATLARDLAQAQAKGKRALNQFFKQFRHANGNKITKAAKDGILSLFI